MVGILPHSVFKNFQCSALRRVLGDKFEKCVPHLEEAVRFYQNPTRETPQERARRHKDAVERLEGQCHKVLKTLKKIDPLAREACSWDAIRGREITVKQDYLEDTLPAPDTATAHPELASSFYDLARPPWARGEIARAALEDLIQDLHAWKKVAHAFARRPRGRQNRKRQRLNRWVGIVLKQAGIPLTTRVRGGQLALTIRVVDQAAGLPVPKDLFRDLQDVCDRLQTLPSRQSPAPREITAINRAKNSAIPA